MSHVIWYSAPNLFDRAAREHLIWPPRNVVDFIIYYAMKYSPALLSRWVITKAEPWQWQESDSESHSPGWMCALSLLELAIMVPFYIVAIIAFWKKSEHIRFPTIVYALVAIFGTVASVFYQIITEVHRSSILVILFVNSPWIFVPFLLLARSTIDRVMFAIESQYKQLWTRTKTKEIHFFLSTS